MSGHVVARTAAAIRQEILASPWRGRPAKTIFFGGGTPTFFEADHLRGILDAVLEVHPPTSDCEITSEANPGTADAGKFRAMREAGFNRLSLGAQSFRPDDLVRLGRVHHASDVGKAVRLARDAGFDNLNLDLMFALPGQSLAAWRQNLELALALAPEHVSLYCLTIEPNTRYYKLHLRGMLDLPDDERQVEMYDEAVRVAESAGLAQYEISNFARPGRECLHNLCYWRAEEYAGYGPGAVGALDEGGRRVRRTVLKHPERYCAAVEAGGDLSCETEELDANILRTERIMLGIRLREGIAADLASPRGLQRCVERGWVRMEFGQVLLTPSGRHFCTDVASELV